MLDVVLDKLNEFLESTKELKDHVISAMIYPAILSLTGTVSIIILLTFVLPKVLRHVFRARRHLPSQHQAPPRREHRHSGPTGGSRRRALLVLGIAAKSYMRSSAARYQWDALKLRLAGDVVRKLETARFCRTLGTLLRSGVSFLQALNNSKDVIRQPGHRFGPSTALQREQKKARASQLPLLRRTCFPPLALSMIKVGEETGQLDTMLLKVAAVYEKSLREAVKSFVSFLEPAMILIMGLVIGFIVISMLMAVFSITDVPF